MNIYDGWVQKRCLHFEFKVEQLSKFHSVTKPNDKGILCLYHKVRPFEILVFQITLTLNPEKRD